MWIMNNGYLTSVGSHGQLLKIICLVVCVFALTATAAAQDDTATPPAAQPGDAAAEGAAAEQGTAEEGDADSSPQPDSAESDGQSATADQPSFGLIGDFLGTPPLGYMFTGGLFMWPILLMGVIAAGVIIERYRSLKMLETDSSEVRTTVQTMLNERRLREAFDYCNGQQGPVPAILATGLRKYIMLQALDYDAAKTEEQVVKSMDDYSVHIVAALERHLPILATISSAAPMLGFLGTVQGMIVAFDDIVRKMGEVNIIEAAASGIKVSLMTTCFGLIIGIPAFVAFNYFTSVINRFVLDVEESATELIESVTLQTAVDRAEGES